MDQKLKGEYAIYFIVLHIKMKSLNKTKIINIDLLEKTDPIHVQILLYGDISFDNVLTHPEAYAEPWQTSKMELFVKIVNGWKL